MNKAGKLFSKYLVRFLCGIVAIGVINILFYRYNIIPRELLFKIEIVIFFLFALSFCKRDDYTYVGTFPVDGEGESSSFVLLKSSTHVYLPFFLKYISPFYYRTLYTSYYAVPNCADPRMENGTLVNRDTISYLSGGICEINYEVAKSIIDNPESASSYVSGYFAWIKDSFLESVEKYSDEGSTEVISVSPYFAVVRSNNDTYGLFPFGAKDSHGFVLKKSDADRFISYPEGWAQFIFHNREYQLDVNGISLYEFLSQKTSDGQSSNTILSKAHRRLLTYEIIEKRLQAGKVVTIFFAVLFAMEGVGVARVNPHDQSFIVCGIVLLSIAVLLLIKGLSKKRFLIKKSIIKEKYIGTDQDDDDVYTIKFMDGYRKNVPKREYDYYQEGESCYALYKHNGKKLVEIYCCRDWILDDDLKSYLSSSGDIT